MHVARERTTRPGNYAEQAKTYDLTRGASPSLVRALAKHLGPADGRSLLDVAAGTGNYTAALKARGFDVTLLDANEQMLARSVSKVGPGAQVAGDALALPFADDSFDCMMMTQALHLIRDHHRVFGEVVRVLRGGPFVLQVYTRENLAPLFVFDYFPGSRPDVGMHPAAGEVERWLLEAGFERVEREAYVYLDTADANLHALHTDHLRLAGPAYLRNTSFFHRLSAETRREGLARLSADLRSGVLEEKVKASFGEATRSGHGTVFAAYPARFGGTGG